jgi:transcription factor C subunit 6
MTDLSRAGQSLCTQASTVFSNRTRFGHPLLTWHDYTQIVLHTDEGMALRGSSIRRLFATMDLGRCGSSATCLASSPCHPCVLVGTAHGGVFATNPTKRIVDAASTVWQQAWFTHEWRRQSAEEAEIASQGNGGVEGTGAGRAGLEHTIPASGLSRISEGFRADRALHVNETHQDSGNLFATIYEEKSAITAVAWNPNLHTGGWAAAGMADGLLRVEDIAA